MSDSKSARPVCVVTGSSSGIGAAAAVKFAGQGYDIIINFSRDPAPAEKVAEQCRALGAKVLVQKADVSKDADCRKLAEYVEAQFGTCKVLVNNAGTTKFVGLKNLEGVNAEDFHNIYAVNTIGAFQMTRAFAPLMRQSKGASIVNVSSIAAVMGVGSSIAYMASKGALNAMTIALARALGPEIRVNGVAPGMIDSDWLRNGLGPERYAATKEAFTSKAALEDIISPEDVAETIYFLAVGAPKTTGEVLLVDSGFKIGRA
jgi:3-oxoacyl-[acyl-carrier protein] reductase